MFRDDEESAVFPLFHFLFSILAFGVAASREPLFYFLFSIFAFFALAVGFTGLGAALGARVRTKWTTCQRCSSVSFFLKSGMGLRPSEIL